ncbi:NADP-dependent phosphogluconate dehydrogenase [Robertkochia aurantiaca]|uniref:NADP-dependent phosphogluconate dehydrogenase n=1 Tax=Robertkochia aurantiaca TaxID=2873700 RepID=UPI001CC92023|nr:NADP-dependent phosphogluconate dehydrogenase [Robertkochia sp. 3YJGBD-33]
MNLQRPQAIILMGVSGSGKTTIGRLLSERTGILYYDADDYHPRENINKMKNGQALNDDDRLPWLSKLNELLKENLSKDKSCILGCSALRQSYRDILTSGLGPSFKFIHLKGSFETIEKRQKERKDHFMPAKLLKSQFDTLEDAPEAFQVSVEANPEELVNLIEDHLFNKTEFGIVGIGTMGKSLARNLGRKHIRLSLYNRHEAGKEENVARNAKNSYAELKESLAFDELPAFITSLQAPRKILLMIPAGPVIDSVIDELLPLLQPGDVLIDGGNSHYRDTLERSLKLSSLGYHFIGCGISGGERGALEGPSLMPGGDLKAYRIIAPYLKEAAAKDRNGEPCCSWTGGDGAGHFVKIIHNGIEYGEMQLLAEICTLLKISGHDNDEISAILSAWNDTFLEGYLLKITARIFAFRDKKGWLIDRILDKAGNKGTGSWATVAATELGVPATMISTALFERYLSFFKERRMVLSKSYNPIIEKTGFDTSEIKKAFRAARLINHAQGFELIAEGGNKHGWPLNLSEIARVWTNGCIIRSELMERLSERLKVQEDILQQTETKSILNNTAGSLKNTVARAITSGVSVPALSSAANYLNGITTAEGSAGIIQAQRDFFGAHTYQLKDDPNQNFYHTQWE